MKTLTKLSAILFLGTMAVAYIDYLACSGNVALTLAWQITFVVSVGMVGLSVFVLAQE